MWPFSKAKAEAKPEPEPLAFTQALMEQALLAYKGEGAHFSLYYANLGGHLENVIKPETTQAFTTVIEAEPNFTEAGRRYAIDRLIDEVDFVCSADVFDMIVFGHRNDTNLEHRECLLAWRAAVNQRGFAALCERIGFDALDFLERTTIARRQADLGRVIAKLEERKDYLKPLLLRAIAKGKNKYGEVDYGAYLDELSEFLAYYFPQGSLPFFYNRYPLVSAVTYLEKWLQDAPAAGVIPLDGIDFEYWCAARLEEQGWAVRVSKASGDQGVDIEAMKGGKSVAVQCKRYTQPIGNKAVQEAYAGMVHYQAVAACVIGTGGFTPSALELARSTGVILIDADSISEFSYLIDAHTNRQ